MTIIMALNRSRENLATMKVSTWPVYELLILNYVLVNINDVSPGEEEEAAQKALIVPRLVDDDPVDNYPPGDNPDDNSISYNGHGLNNDPSSGDGKDESKDNRIDKNQKVSCVQEEAQRVRENTFNIAMTYSFFSPHLV